MEDVTAELKDASLSASVLEGHIPADWELTDGDRLGDFADAIDAPVPLSMDVFRKFQRMNKMTDVLEALDNDSSDSDKREPQLFTQPSRQRFQIALRKDV